MKRWIKQYRNQIRSAVIGMLAIVLAVGGWWTVRLYQNRKAVEAVIAERQAAALATTAPEPSSEDDGSEELLFFTADEVEYEGKTYRRNTYMKSILCIGVDRKDSMQEYKGFNEAGQADGLFLLAQDTARNELKILMIPRDTMAEITVINPDMSVHGTEVRQLTLAYANGDGREGSCENQKEAVEHFLKGFPIDHYFAADMTMINTLNDAVGGVTVTVPTSGMEQRDPAFVQGATVTLHGEQAEAFVRFRDIERNYSALYRMDQQQEYITQFFETVRQQSQKDSQMVPRLFEMVQDHMITDMGKETYLKVALDAVSGDSLSKEDFFTIPGRGMTTELYDEYYADEKAIIPLILRLFYREV